MKSIDQIITDAKAALTRQRANEAEAAATAAREKHEVNAKLWEPIVDGLKVHIPAELHDAISFDADNPPNANEHWEPSQRLRRPIRITLPTPEQYTVFGYWYDEKCYGFAAGGLSYRDGEPYWMTRTNFHLTKYEVGSLPNFEIALAQTVEGYSPRKPAPPKVWNPAPPTVADQFIETLREFVRKEIQNHAESGE